MRIFITREFWKSEAGNTISKAGLLKAAAELNKGLWDANLGGEVYKKRVGLPGRGKRGGAGLCLPSGVTRGLFLCTDLPGTKETITSVELRALKRLANELLNYG
jgi:hypothetical protein